LARKQVTSDRGRRVPAVRRAAWLVGRGSGLAKAEYHYNWLVTVFHKLFTGLEGNEFAAKADRQALARLEAVLEGEIRPAQQAVREEFVGLFGFAWRDRVRVANRGRPTVELEPTELWYHPWEARPTARLAGRALKRDGRPGEKVVQTPLILGVSVVTVLSAAADRG
jgi:hypothetical protein